MNSHRDNVKDVVSEWLDPMKTEDDDLRNAESATLADLIFNA